MSFDRQCPKCLEYLDTLTCDSCGLVDLHKCPEARIEQDTKDGYTIFTSHLVDNHGSDTCPLWYETMITTPCGDFMEYQTRCETRIEAMKMHQDALDYLNEFGPPRWKGWRKFLGLK